MKNLLLLTVFSLSLSGCGFQEPENSLALQACKEAMKQYPEADVRLIITSAPYSPFITYGCSIKVDKL